MSNASLCALPRRGPGSFSLTGAVYNAGGETVTLGAGSTVMLVQ